MNINKKNAEKTITFRPKTAEPALHFLSKITTNELLAHAEDVSTIIRYCIINTAKQYGYESIKNQQHRETAFQSRRGRIPKTIIKRDNQRNNRTPAKRDQTPKA
jgi:hypothetical protein